MNGLFFVARSGLSVCENVADTIKWVKLRYVDVFRRLCMICGALLLVVSAAEAQYDVSFSHYFDMEPSFNPASVGKETKVNVTGAYAMDLAGFRHNPRTMYIAGDMPFYMIKSYHGVGVQLMNDQIGLFQHQRLALQYAYKHRLFGGTLSAGLQAGFISENFDGTGVDVIDPGDPVFATSEVNGNAIDLAFGLYYLRKQWYAGVSVQHLTAPLVELGQTNELQIDRTYYLTGGYNIKLRNPFVTIPTSLLVRTDGVAYRADITARLLYTNDKKVMYIGAAYSPTNSVTLLVGGRIHGIQLGYSYEFYTSAINPGNGSHELFVGYQTDLNLYKKGRNKHKSVRLL